MPAYLRISPWKALLVFAAVLSGCGGGSSGGSSPSSAPIAQSTATTYTATAMAGELLTYKVDTTALTYSYTITDSQYGLNGKTGSGTLTLNSDGTYSPSGMVNAKAIVLPNGLLLGAIRENFGGMVTTVPVIGMSNPVTALSSGQGTYDFVQRSCLGGTCATAYGTFLISPSGTWTSCPSGNMGVNTQAEFLGLIGQALKRFFCLITLRRLIANELLKSDTAMASDLTMLQTPLLDLLVDERPGDIQKVRCLLD